MTNKRDTRREVAAETAESAESAPSGNIADTAVSAATSSTARETAGRAGRALAYWRWGKLDKLLEAAGQLALFARPSTSEHPQPSEPKP
jgi:hypothetical protein